MFCNDIGNRTAAVLIKGRFYIRTKSVQKRTDKFCFTGMILTAQHADIKRVEPHGFFIDQL
jgi:hypothetical protein